MKKTVYIHPYLESSEFTQGFLSASEWEIVSDSFETSVVININDFGHIQCVLRKSSPGLICPVVKHVFKDASGNPYELIIHVSFAFSRYVAPSKEIPKSKMIYAVWEKQKLQSEFEIGKAFGVFATDAINEEDYLETKNGASAAVSFIDEFPEEYDLREFHYTMEEVPYEEARHIEFRVRED